MEPRSRPSTSAWDLPTALAAVAVAGVYVFHGALAYFFAQDDFAGLARASGHLPRLAGPWRYVSGQLYFDAMHALAGLHPAPYHAVSLAAHVACAVLLVLVLRARVSVAAALAGALVFVTHPSLYTALYSISGIGEILALFFALATILVARGRGPWRWAAVPLFALSLLSKESLLLLPVVVALDARGPSGRTIGPRPSASRVPLAAWLGVVAAGYLAIFLEHDVFGVWKALPAQAPYALAFDSTIVANLLSYAGWAANFTVVGVHSFSDAVDPGVTGWGIGALLLLAAGLLAPKLRQRGWGIGTAAFAVFLLPVLPLAHHTYHYYLYAPLVGIAACVAAAGDVLLERFATGRRPRTEPAKGSRRRKQAGAPPAEVAPAPAPADQRPSLSVIAVLGLGALLAWNGAALVQKVETTPFTIPIMRSDPTVDRARIALRMRDDLAKAGLVPGERLVFWSPSSIAIEMARGHDTREETYWEKNVRCAVADDVGLRVLFPRLGPVEFVHEFRPLEAGTHWAVYAPDGRVALMSTAAVSAALRDGQVPP